MLLCSENDNLESPAQGLQKWLVILSTLPKQCKEVAHSWRNSAALSDTADWSPSKGTSNILSGWKLLISITVLLTIWYYFYMNIEMNCVSPCYRMSWKFNVYMESIFILEKKKKKKKNIRGLFNFKTSQVQITGRYGSSIMSLCLVHCCYLSQVTIRDRVH